MLLYNLMPRASSSSSCPEDGGSGGNNSMAVFFQRHLNILFVLGSWFLYLFYFFDRRCVNHMFSFYCVAEYFLASVYVLWPLTSVAEYGFWKESKGKKMIEPI